MDDGNIIESIRHRATLPLHELFNYRGQNTYFRPLLTVSYLFDAWLWDLKPAAMHLVNILLHVCNASLVYLCLRQFFSGHDKTIRIPPLTGAMLFLVHPINTESINWISGRTDPLAALFCLLATVLIVKLARDNSSRPSIAWTAALLLLTGSLVKEVAVALFPASIVFLVIYRPVQFDREALPWLWRLKLTIPFLLGLTGYFLLRTSALQHLDRGLAIVVEQPQTGSYIRNFSEILTAAGFYGKKLLLPQPLSFSIDSVSPAYFWLGIALLIMSLAVLCKRNLQSFLVLCLSFAVAPALLNAALKIAWTPYAERYLYLPSAFFCMILTLTIYSSAKSTSRVRLLAVLVLLLSFLPTTINRNLLWGDPLQLIETTHKENPGNPTVWTMYATALANRGHYQLARTEYQQILNLHPRHLFTYEAMAQMELYIDSVWSAHKTLEPFYSESLVPNQAIRKIMQEVEMRTATGKDSLGTQTGAVQRP